MSPGTLAAEAVGFGPILSARQEAATSEGEDGKQVSESLGQRKKASHHLSRGLSKWPREVS